MTEDVLEYLRQEAEKIPHHKIYFTLKQMKIKPLTRQIIETMKICKTLENLNIPITGDLVSAILKVKSNSAFSRLHILGDKNALTLIRGGKGRFRWMINPIFQKVYDGESN